MNNPIQYTSRTFESILNDINSDTELIDKPNWFKRGLAGIGDIISMWVNALANNLLLRTSFTRRNVQLLLELIDYTLTPQTTSSGTLLFYLDPAISFPHLIAIEDLVGLTSGTISASSKRFEARASKNVTSATVNFGVGDVNTGTDVITVTRVFLTGEKIRLTTTGTLPSPLTLVTDYYVIYVSDTEVKLATTLANAYAGTQIDITTTGAGTHTITLFSTQVDCYQQTLKDEFIIGTSDGIEEFQEYILPDINILKETLIVTINSLPWTQVDTLVDSISTDRHYRVFLQSDNSLVIQFGNGTYGMIPPAFDIYVSYAYGGGEDSNISAVNGISIYGGGDTNVLGVSNPSAFTGGNDAESIESAKALGPLLLKARNRFVTSADGEALALAYGGISLTKVIPNEYGVLSAKVVNIATGGGNLSGAAKTALQTYLIERSVLESMDVRVEDATITSVNVTSAAKVLTGYTWTSQVENYFRLAWKLILSEAGQEIVDDYEADGIDSARALINTIFTESFTSSDNAQIINFLDNLLPRQFGEDIYESDVVGFIAAFTFGVDYLTITLPAFPITLANDEITTYGSLTLTEIP